MHSFARHFHREADFSLTQKTKELILDQGWRYDLGIWFMDSFLFRGQLRQLRQRIVSLALMQPGEEVLDVGCGTGMLAMEVQGGVGRAGRVTGVDPRTRQIARARAKAARRNVPIDFQIGVIEQLAFPDQTFDVVLSTIMMHLSWMQARRDPEKKEREISMRNVFLRHTTKEGTPMPARRSTTNTPRWVKVSVVIIIILVLLFVILHLTGHGFGNHMHMAIIEAGGQPL